MRKIITYIILCSLCSCTIEAVRTDRGNEELVYKDAKNSNDSVTYYTYVTGDKFCEVYDVGHGDNKTRDSITYHRNGNVMSYRVRYKGDLVYYRLYNDKGESYKYDGSGTLFADPDAIVKINIIKDSTYRTSIRLVNPPNCKVVTMISEYQPGKLSERDFNKYPIYTYKVINSLVGYRYRYENAGIEKGQIYWGSEKVQIYWAIHDTITKDIQNGKFIHQYSLLTED